MDQRIVIDVAQEAIKSVLLVSAPILGLGLLVGLIVSIVQATTQIQEPTLSFIPKIIAVSLTMLVFGPWMMNIMYEFTVRLFENIPSYIK
ncbi:MAG TPA: flagellar biosynthesis protein FliQ [Bacillota bacterium]|nr:flagellar biosynthesis protein FliQ [Bacillota bacterium]HRS22481.1 flagellar biosynthesis protein FliQ [Clostridia bacterium]HRU41921.1 flagellar biosynthesis protein FliQ [Candidatus Diapherotrites archaeon]HQE65484.1 flagellar biosynthesis protein FliQ [Bacillota bacterium]HQI15432.1 flagellar biosynthesis protein FliQ [Bacillota bacterium]